LKSLAVEPPLPILTELPTRRMDRVLIRCVSQVAFMARIPPRYLYTSGRPGRCNPPGVACLYASESEATANSEYLGPLAGTQARHQPRLLYFAQVKLAKIVDCGDASVREMLTCTDDDFYGTWRLAPVSTRLQRLGLALSRQRAISAVRFPSHAAHLAGRPGWNVAIYPAALAPPDRVDILGPDSAALESLP
jgi:RES domain-containing protein